MPDKSTGEVTLLDYPKFQVRRIDLAYHDGKDVRETENIYEPLGAFGNMLLERAPLWCAPSTAPHARCRL